MSKGLGETSDKVVRESLSEEVAFEPRLNGERDPAKGKGFQADGTAFVKALSRKCVWHGCGGFKKAGVAGML